MYRSSFKDIHFWLKNVLGLCLRNKFVKLKFIYYKNQNNFWLQKSISWIDNFMDKFDNEHIRQINSSSRIYDLQLDNN